MAHKIDYSKGYSRLLELFLLNMNHNAFVYCYAVWCVIVKFIVISVNSGDNENRKKTTKRNVIMNHQKCSDRTVKSIIIYQQLKASSAPQVYW